MEYEVEFVCKTYHNAIVEADNPDAAIDVITERAYGTDPDFIPNEEYLTATLCSNSFNKDDPYYDRSVEVKVVKYPEGDGDPKLLAQSRCKFKYDLDGFDVQLTDEYAEPVLEVLKAVLGHAGEDVNLPYIYEKDFYEVKGESQRLKVAFNRIKKAMLLNRVNYQSEAEKFTEEMDNFREPLCREEEEYLRDVQS